MKHLLLSGCLIFSLHGLSQPVAGLVAHYTFAGNANDVSGHSLNGIVHGATLTADQYGHPNQAYSFNGVSNYIDLPVDSFLLNNYTYSVCLEAASLPIFNGTDQRTILSIGNIMADQVVCIGNVPIAIGFNAYSYYSTSAPPDNLNVGTLPIINRYYHVIATRNNTVFKLYVDGILIASTNVHNAIANYGTGIRFARIGGRVSNEQYFHGVIDDVAIYNRALTDSEIQSYSCGCNLSINLGADTAVCFGSGLNLNAGSGTGLSYSWFFNGTMIPGAASQTFHPTQSGQYKATINNGSCSASDSVNVTIRSLPIVTASPDTSICNGSSVTLSASGAVNYQWSPASGLNTTTGSAVVASPSSTINYVVTGSDANNCRNVDSVLVTVHNLPVITASQDTVICNGTSVTLAASGAVNYQWSPAIGLNTTTGSVVVASPSSTINYTVTGSDANNCKNVETVLIHVIPLPAVTVFPGGPLYFLRSMILLSATVGSGYTYEWYHDSIKIAGASSSQLVVTAPGNYLVKIMNAQGCSASPASVQVSIPVHLQPE